MWTPFEVGGSPARGLPILFKAQPHLLVLRLQELPLPTQAKIKSFIRQCNYRKRGKGFKLKEGRLRLNVRKKILTVKVVRHWNRLRREIVDVPSPDVFSGNLELRATWSSLM